MSSVDDCVNKLGYIQSGGEQMPPQNIPLQHKNSLDLINVFFLRGHLIISETQVQGGSSESHLQEKSHFKGMLCIYQIEGWCSCETLFYQ